MLVKRHSRRDRYEYVQHCKWEVSITKGTKPQIFFDDVEVGFVDDVQLLPPDTDVNDLTPHRLKNITGSLNVKSLDMFVLAFELLMHEQKAVRNMLLFAEGVKEYRMGRGREYVRRNAK